MVIGGRPRPADTGDILTPEQARAAKAGSTVVAIEQREA